MFDWVRYTPPGDAETAELGRRGDVLVGQSVRRLFHYARMRPGRMLRATGWTLSTALRWTGFDFSGICVPIEAESHFLNLYARDISRVNPETKKPQPQCLHLIERRTEVFRFFADLDEKRYDAGWDRVNRIEYVKTIQRAMRRFFPEVDDDTARSLFQCVLCLPHTGAVPIGNAEGEVEGIVTVWQ